MNKRYKVIFDDIHMIQMNERYNQISYFPFLSLIMGGAKNNITSNKDSENKQTTIPRNCID